MATIDTIIVPIDFSDTSIDALRLASELARASHGHLKLLHVIPDPLQQPWLTQAPGVDYLAMEDAWRDDALKQLKALASQVMVAGEAVAVAVRTGKPADAILAYAEEQQADLIVMGAHGESAVMRFFLGSIAERVVRHATLPVLTVPRGCATASAEARTEVGNAAGV